MSPSHGNIRFSIVFKGLLEIGYNAHEKGKSICFTHLDQTINKGKSKQLIFTSGYKASLHKQFVLVLVLLIVIEVEAKKSNPATRNKISIDFHFHFILQSVGEN